MARAVGRVVTDQLLLEGTELGAMPGADDDGLQLFTERETGEPRVCSVEGCDELVTWRGYGFPPITCAEHRTTHKKKATGKAKRDTPPRNINVNLGPQPTKGGKKDAELAAVEARAKQLATTIAAVVLLTGNQDDAGDIAAHSDEWAKAVRDLAEYEAWLRKLAAGGEAAGRATAWINLAIVTASILLPILIRHDALPANVKQIAANMVGMAQSVTGADQAA